MTESLNSRKIPTGEPPRAQPDVAPASEPRDSTTRFGPYELDLRSRVLRKDGLKVKIAGQPLEILVFLLQRPGELVAREEIREHLWPAASLWNLTPASTAS